MSAQAIPTREELIQDLKDLAKEHPETLITRDFYRRHGAFSEADWTSVFGRFAAFKKAAELDVQEAVSARRGEVGAPPLPPQAVPPEGFQVVQNSARYDDAGNLEAQWVKTRAGGIEEWEILPSHRIKGESVLVDATGKVTQRWVKTREDSLGHGLVESIREAFAEYAGAASILPAPAILDQSLLTVYPIPDLHLGMLSWSPETLGTYDIKIATDMALEAIGELVAQSRPSGQAVVLGLGDYFHSNDSSAVTPANKHRLDVDGRWPKVFSAGARLATRIVDLVAQKHDQVEVVWLAGNHDPDAAVCLSVAMELFYQANPRISVNDGACLHWYRRFGKCLLGATHGHSVKPDAMAMMMASDRPDDWGATVHRHMMFGHLHHTNVRDVGPVRVEGFTTPAARDAYAHGHGYRSTRSLTAITYHEERGEIGRHKVNLT